MMRRLSSSSLTRLRRPAPPLSSRLLSSFAQQQQSRRKERQRRHEEQMALARAAKEERRLEHARKQAQAEAAIRERRERHSQLLEEANEKKQATKRKNAARSVPYWLGNEERCFELTMEALNLNTVARQGLLKEYRQVYLYSIPSFYQSLVDEDDELTVQNEDAVVKALNALVEVGFDDLKWAKHYRQRMEQQANLERVKARILRTKVQRDKQADKLQKYQDKLAQETQEENEPTEGFIDRALKTVSSFFSSMTTEQETIPVERTMGNQKGLLRVITDVERKVERYTRSLENLEAELDSYAYLITQEEYDRANEVVHRVMGDICKALAVHIHKRHSEMIDQYKTLDAKTDLTKPHEWYLHARLDRRKIIFHAGPTNSGKTYAALEALKKAKRGLYLGPLRLLAAEVYETLTSQGVYTNLFTGQEKREIPFATHAAATVEMAPTYEEFDVVVIDEIQMISDPYRGYAWTRALMGIRCKEIHICGGLEARNIVQRIADLCGDELQVIAYERFSSLSVAERSLAATPSALGSYKAVRPGDCVVAFSRNDIFAIKREIEQTTDYKCCVIYGSLPPETRTDQARRFNDPDSGYDILVASDAIGMGLNLNIRRIIFNSLFKFTGDSIVRLDHSSVKQISGRAGRRNSPFPEGEVTCRDPEDMAHLKRCMSTEIAPIRKAGLLPTGEHIELFNEALKAHDELGKEYDNLHKILIQFSEMATLQGDFFLCRQTPMRAIAKFLNDVDMPVSDKYTLCMSPASHTSGQTMSTLKKFAIKHAAGQVSGLDRSAIPTPANSFDDLTKLCGIHNQLELFLWLHNRFPGSNIMEQQSALALKERTIELISKGLAETESLKLNHCYIKRDTTIKREWKERQASKRKKDIDDLDDFLEHSELDEI